MGNQVPQKYSHFIESNTDSWEVQSSIIESLGNYSQRNVEVFLPNEYYGLDLIVKKFIGLDQKASLKFGIPHGVELGDAKFANVYGYRINLSTLTYNNPIGLRNIVNHNVPGRRIPAEHPFLILIEMMRSLGMINNKKIRNATLFFPAHRNAVFDFINKDYDKEICMKLDSLRSMKGEVEISLPFIDIEMKRHLTYENFGFNVVSSGHIFDPKFLSRFINLTTSYNRIASAEVGSHLIYSAAVGCSTEFWNLGMPLVQQIDAAEHISDPYEIDPTTKALFQSGKRIDHIQASQLLGWTSAPISQSYWLWLQKSSVKRDRYSFIELEGNTKKFTIPQALRRLLKRTLKGVIRTAKVVKVCITNSRSNGRRQFRIENDIS